MRHALSPLCISRFLDPFFIGLLRLRFALLVMAGPEEMTDAQPASAKRPSIDVDSLQRKKFKTDELPLSAAKHSAIEDLLHSFKKKGGFDNIRKKIWADFHDGVHLFSCLFFYG